MNNFNNFNPNRLEYLIVLLVCSLPVILLTLLHPKNTFGKHLKQALPAMLISAIPFLIWDVLATHYNHWAFNQKYVIGLYAINLPLEEVGFFFIVPFCCLFLWNEFTEFRGWKDFMNRLF
jgi:lycopene cyclase domain-containing protein